MTTVKKTHWFRNTLIVLIICGLVGTVLAAVLFFGESNQTYATAAIQFSFDGAAEGKAPNGYPFDVSGITSDEVLEIALKAGENRGANDEVCLPAGCKCEYAGGSFRLSRNPIFSDFV